MSRLPKTGSDDGQWGDILNDYLSQIHAADGTLKPNVVNAVALAPSAVTSANLQESSIVAGKLNAGNGVNGDILTKDSAASGGMKWVTPTGNGGTIADGSVTSAKLADGSVTAPKLSADSPVNGMILSYNNGALVWVSNTSSATLADGSITTIKLADGNVTGPKIAADTVAESNLTQAVRDKLNAAGTTTIADNSITAAKLSADTPAQNEVLSYNGTGLEWITPQAASGGGEVNTASNIGTAGVGLFKSKAGVNLGFKNIASTNSLVSITDNTSTDSVDITLATGANGVATLGTDGKVPASQLPAATGGSSFGFTLKTVTASTTAVSGDYIIADPAAGKITITLPANIPNGFVRVKRICSTASISSVDVVTASGSNTVIDGSDVGAHTLNAQYESIEFWSDGTNWYR